MRRDIKVSLDCAECFIAQLITIISSVLKLLILLKLLMYERRSVKGLMTVACHVLIVTVHDLPANRLGFQDGTNALPLLKVQGKLVLNHVSLTDVRATVRKRTKRKLVMTLPLLKIICVARFG